MRRKFVTLAAVLSGALCVTFCGLWVRSRVVVRDYAWAFVPWPGDAQGRRFVKVDFDSDGGQLGVDWKVWTAADRVQLILNNGLGATTFYHHTFPDIRESYERSDPTTAWNAIGFKWYSGKTHSGVRVPYWFCVALTAILPGLRFTAAIRRRRRRTTGLCPKCGYDLRATPGRCPECGTQIHGSYPPTESRD